MNEFFTNELAEELRRSYSPEQLRAALAVLESASEGTEYACEHQWDTAICPCCGMTRTLYDLLERQGRRVT